MKAIIPAAGLGTRFAPISRYVPKEMLPLGTEPLIRHAINEALSVPEIDGVVVVSSPKKRVLNEYAASLATEDGFPIEIVYQWEPSGLGSAVLLGCSKVPEGEQFAVLLPDYALPDSDVLAEMVSKASRDGRMGIVGMGICPLEDTRRYGIGDIGILSAHVGSFTRLFDIVEKPEPVDAPSNLYAVGRYVLPYEVRQLLAGQEPGHGDEVQLTDALRVLAKEDALSAYVMDARSGFDTGTPREYAESVHRWYASASE